MRDTSNTTHSALCAFAYPVLPGVTHDIQRKIGGMTWYDGMNPPTVPITRITTDDAAFAVTCFQEIGDVIKQILLRNGMGLRRKHCEVFVIKTAMWDSIEVDFALSEQFN